MRPAVILLVPFFTVLLAASSARGAETVLCLEIEPGCGRLGPLELRIEHGRVIPASLYLQADFWDCDWRLGFVPVDWGPSPGEDLLFSGRGGLPALWAATDFRGFEILPALHYENFYARLSPRGGSGRWLIGRRYTFGGGRWRAGVTEAALLSGDFSPYYFIPYPFFPLSVGKVFLTACGVGDPKDANLLYGLDLAWEEKANRLYASLLIDEAPLTPAWEGPWRAGFQFGGERRAIPGRPDLSLWAEYTALSRYVFTCHEGYARGDYWDEGGPLGHPLGPDADLLRLRLMKERNGRSFWLEISRERHGEGEPGDRWEPSAGKALRFLTGTVETIYWLRAGFGLPLGGENRFELGLGTGRVENQAHRAGEMGWKNRMEVALSLNL